MATDGFLNEFFPECRTGGVFRNRSSSGEAFLYWVSLISAGVYGVFQFGFCDRYWFNVLALQCLLYFHPAAKWLNFRYLAAPSEEEGSCKERGERTPNPPRLPRWPVVPLGGGGPTGFWSCSSLTGGSFSSERRFIALSVFSIICALVT